MAARYTRTIAAVVKPATYQALEAEADREELTLSELMRGILEQHVRAARSIAEGA